VVFILLTLSYGRLRRGARGWGSELDDLELPARASGEFRRGCVRCGLVGESEQHAFMGDIAGRQVVAHPEESLKRAAQPEQLAGDHSDGSAAEVFEQPFIQEGGRGKGGGGEFGFGHANT